MTKTSNETVEHKREIVQVGAEDRPPDEQSPVTPGWQDKTQRMVALHHTIFPTGHQLEDDVLVYHWRLHTPQLTLHPDSNLQNFLAAGQFMSSEPQDL